MTLAEKIVAARKRKGYTQEELADLAAVAVRTIQRIESGETIPRSLSKLFANAVLLIDTKNRNFGLIK
jgi:transcriptional regulator with XRE-family HTH domain